MKDTAEPYNHACHLGRRMDSGYTPGLGQQGCEVATAFDGLLSMRHSTLVQLLLLLETYVSRTTPGLRTA
jgi:hypothetical protein